MIISAGSACQENLYNALSMESWLIGSPYPGMIVWFILYTSDYYMTLATAKGYKEMGIFLHEKSFELTPQFQKDIDNGARVSKLHLTFLIGYTLLIGMFWFLCYRVSDLPWLYSILIGALTLLEVVVHLRHLRNWYQLRVYRREGGLSGQVIFAERFSYRLSSFDFYIHALLFGLYYLLTYSPFFLGGVLICFVNGVKQSSYASRAPSPRKTQPSDSHADSSSG
jgi:hypothetical protein